MTNKVASWTKKASVCRLPVREPCCIIIGIIATGPKALEGIVRELKVTSDCITQTYLKYLILHLASDHLYRGRQTFCVVKCRSNNSSCCRYKLHTSRVSLCMMASLWAPQGLGGLRPVCRARRDEETSLGCSLGKRQSPVPKPTHLWDCFGGCLVSHSRKPTFQLLWSPRSPAGDVVAPQKPNVCLELMSKTKSERNRFNLHPGLGCWKLGPFMLSMT